jgi:3-oxoacyl-[acyl-carrier-protein] synthase-1
VITGIAMNTPIGDTLDDVGNGLLSGKSAIGYWRNFDTSKIHSKIGGQLPPYDVERKLQAFEGRIPDAVLARAQRVKNRPIKASNYRC